jgi:hypothetical protein
MSGLTQKVLIAIALLLGIWLQGMPSDPKDEMNELLLELNEELQQSQYFFEKENSLLLGQLVTIKATLKTTTTLELKVSLLIERDNVHELLRINGIAEASEISKIRYLKGLQIMKILYEKTLTLDHHFTSVATFNDINKLSNPNQYPEFIKMREDMKGQQDKKTGFQLTSILGDNIYASVAHSLISLFNTPSTSKKEKEDQLKDVECILDFTLRMHNDLNTIYFETAFLQKSNDNVSKELEQLFTDYTKPIKYMVSLKECRNNDDWEAIKEKLTVYLDELDRVAKVDSERFKAHKMQINLEFPIDRLLQFIILYNNHIDQGGKFYEKFGIMLNSYEHEQQCASKIPVAYKKLKDNVAITIEKFNTAYKPVEINGSKMKQILYGINEFD